MLKRFLLILVSGYLIACESQNSSQNTSSKPTNEKIKQEETQKITPQETSNSEKIDTSTTERTEYIYWTPGNASICFRYYLDKKYLKEQQHKGISFFYNRLPPIEFDGQNWEAVMNKDIILPEYYHKKIMFKNEKTGYIRAKSDTKNPLLQTEIALFTTKNKNFIVVNHYNKKTSLNFLALQENIKDDFNPEKLINKWNNKSIYEFFGEDGQFIVKNFVINAENNSYDFYFKLPEYGTTILACRDKRDFIESPDVFWADKIKNYPQDIIYLDWQADKGRFSVRK